MNNITSVIYKKQPDAQIIQIQIQFKFNYHLKLDNFQFNSLLKILTISYLILLAHFNSG